MTISDLLHDITPPAAAKGEQDDFTVVVDANGIENKITGARWDHRERKVIIEIEEDL